MKDASIYVSPWMVATTTLHTPGEGDNKGLLGSSKRLCQQPLPFSCLLGSLGTTSNFKCIDAKRKQGCRAEEWGAGSCRGCVSAPHPFPLGLQVDGVSYLLQEIYGIENKYNTQDSKVLTCTPQPASRWSSLVPLPLPPAQVQQLRHTCGKSLQHNMEMPGAMEVVGVGIEAARSRKLKD